MRQNRKPFTDWTFSILIFNRDDVDWHMRKDAAQSSVSPVQNSAATPRWKIKIKRYATVEKKLTMIEVCNIDPVSRFEFTDELSL